MKAIPQCDVTPNRMHRTVQQRPFGPLLPGR